MDQSYWEIMIRHLDAAVVPSIVQTLEEEAPVERVMEPGPTTYRLDRPAEEAAARLKERKVESVLVTTTDGELVGVFYGDYQENPAHRGGTGKR